MHGTRFIMHGRLIVIQLLILLTFQACDHSWENLDWEVKPWYKYREDGKPGREVILKLPGQELQGRVHVIIRCNGTKEKLVKEFDDPAGQFSILLPDGEGVHENCTANIRVITADREWRATAMVPAKRQWKVLIYPHSHVDIGYTNTHANVELIHKRNLVNGLELARKTVRYPEGARYLWNPEVIWPVDRYMKGAGEEEKQVLIQGIRDGCLHLDAGYVNLNTSIAGDEELLEFFRPAKEYEALTGKKIETVVQVDIPGMSWGIVPVASKLGFKYILAFNNGFDRVGRSMDLSFKPFWWSDAQGKNRVLFLQPGSYTPGAAIKGRYFWPDMAGQTDPDKLIRVVKTDHPRENFIDSYLNEKLPELEASDYYPYDIFPMSWAMADNTPIDADLPDAVKSWNEEFAFPRLQIASATDIMRTFEEQYGDDFPVLKGDFTEYWTDGTGTAARQTSMNRSSKERLVQTETLWTMLHKGESAPRDRFDEAWHNIIMGSEHTWCYMEPDKEPISSQILDVKFAHFQDAYDQSQDIFHRTVSETEHRNSQVWAVFNTQSWIRSGYVQIPSGRVGGFHTLVNEDGEPVASQLLSTGALLCRVEDLPPFGSRKYSAGKGGATTGKKIASGNVLDNGNVRVEISEETGDIISLKLHQSEFVDPNADCAINSYRYLLGEDDPEKAFGPRDVKLSIKENGPLLGTIVIKATGRGCHTIVSEVSLYKESEDVLIRNTIDKVKTKEKEGVHFGFAFNIEDPVMVADIPWGYMEIEKDQLPGANRNWIALQRWLDISNDERGITWCPLDAPVFQVGTITANILGGATGSEKWITKLEPSGTIYSWALNNHWHTNFPLSQGGKLTYRYHLKPHQGEYSGGEANRFGIEQAQPLIVLPVNRDFIPGSMLSIRGSESVTATVFKTLRDGNRAMLRLRSDARTDETITLDWHIEKPASVSVFDLENNQAMETVGSEVTVPAMDFVTLLIRWQ